MICRRIAGACASAVVRLAVTAAKTTPRAPRSGSGRRRAAACIALVAMLATGWAFATTYTYDQNNRLNGVTNDSGVTARYAYDNLGNIAQITRPALSTVAIYAFSPGTGAPGVVVTIQGNGFSATPSQDLLRFNGVTATVTAATANQLTVAVPAGTTTGPLAITVGSQTATSSTSFIVNSAAVVPTITGFAPTIGVAGTPVAINGNGLYPVPFETNVYLNQTTAFQTSSANNRIVFPVPPTAGSGKITVTTPYGQATTLQDFLAVPAGIAVGSISTSAVATLGVPRTFTVSTAGNYAGDLFDGSQGQWLTLQFASIPAGTTIAYRVYDPHNNVYLSGGATATNPSVHLPQLSVGGTYLLLMQPSAVPTTWTTSVEQDATLVAGAAPLSIPTTPPGQEKRFVVVVPSGANLGVGISNLKQSTGAFAGLYLYSPTFDSDLESTESAVCYPGATPCDMPLRGQPAGNYTLIVSPSGITTMSFSILLTADVVGSLPLNTPTPMTIARNGQEADFAFIAQQGQTLVFDVSNLTTQAGGCGGAAIFEVVAPDGSTLYSVYDAAGSDHVLNLPYLPQGGTYQIYADPLCGETATAQLTLLPGSAGTLAVNGSAVNFTTNSNAQISYMQFVVPTTTNLGLGLLPNASGGAGLPYWVTLYNASNTALGTTYCQVPGGCFIAFWNLPPGTYTAEGSAYPDGTSTLNFSALLSSELPVSLPVGKATAVTVARNGQIANVTFTATLGQNVTLQVGTPTTTPSGAGITVSVFAPGTAPGVNAALASVTTTTAKTISLPNVAATGTYTAYTYGGLSGAAFSSSMQLTETSGTSSSPSRTSPVTAGSAGRAYPGGGRNAVSAGATSSRIVQ
jgi:YD repeat-containing protein